ncbi:MULTISPECIES: esterase/lipase family protein [unclassified Rathayibacter]|uniref:esterase/lipase family protein n=1 Tax=unclassified Rathayibacter TaxID=2609250 RepID=UPI00188D9EE9|nr:MULTISPECIES: hypothetical protein [unclassified Rathayibacter]MBF4461570.1 hypothetical protein [Rathayibacter sp. VKM Ac-2879]MBF4502981.1 hypothetical protein [Rathayibacter sp. VKM Ac-2878]
MRLVVVMLAILLAVAGAVVVPAGKAEAAVASPPASCGAAQLAPLLPGDDVPAHRPSALVPIIALHGWLGTATHDSSRTGAFSHRVDLVASDDADGPAPTVSEPSLIGMLQRLRGAVVYTFDYRDLAARWVTDPGIADALASSISCVTAATGTRAIVLVHSMGGLAARQALSQSVGGVPVSSMVSEVLSFGTPNTGSDVAKRLGEVIDSSGEASPAVIAGLDPQSSLGLSALMASCGDAATEDAANAGTCTGVPMIDALSSQAGLGLRTGSPQLGELPPWPVGVHVLAMVGDIQVVPVDMLGMRAAPVDLGDIMVATRSAEAGVDEYVVSTCRYTFLTLPTLGSVTAELNPFARWGDAARFASLVVDVDASPCHHAHLTRNIALTTRASAQAARVIAGELAMPSVRGDAPPLLRLPAGEEPRRRPFR